MTEVSNQTALVTGASRGIGRAVALELSRQGYRVYINCRSDLTGAQETRDLLAASRGQGEVLPFDVTNPDECSAAVKTILDRHHRLDVLVNNAGVRDDHLLALMKKSAWDRVIATHLDGFYNVTRPVVRQMIRQKSGRIITISSVAGQVGNAGQVNYAAAKAGLMGATRALAREIAGRGITVNAVSPGYIDTGMLAGMDTDTLLAGIPAGRLGRPEEVAALVGFLCTPAAGYITGQIIGINGGMI